MSLVVNVLLVERHQLDCLCLTHVVEGKASRRYSGTKDVSGKIMGNVLFVVLGDAATLGLTEMEHFEDNLFTILNMDAVFTIV